MSTWLHTPSGMHPKYRKDCRWYWWAYSQASSGDTDGEQNCGHSGGRRGTSWESSMETCTWPYVKQSPWEFGVRCRELTSGALWEPRRMGWSGRWEVGGSFKREGTYVHLWLIHVHVRQRPIQYCRAIFHQWNINFKKQQQSNWFQ